MIQEIYDYLLIRSHFLFKVDEVIEKCSTKENFEETIKAISSVMQNEDYFLAFPETQKSVSLLLQKYRFDYIKNKEINDEMNFIIGRLNEYKNMASSKKDRLAREWLNKEYSDRKMPLTFQDLNNVKVINAYEQSLFMKLIGFELNDECKYKYAGANSKHNGEEIEIFNYLALINLLCARFPVFFYDEENSYNAVFNITNMLNLDNDKKLMKYGKRTLKNLNELLKEIAKLPDEELKKGLIY